MEQYSASCPHCSFVLQFYDASLFGRKGRCPKCRNKFILNKPEADEPKISEARLKPSLPAPKKKPSPAGKSAAKAAKAKSPATAAKKPSARAASTAQAETGQPWETNMNRGLGVRRPMLSARWVFPDVLAISSTSGTTHQPRRPVIQQILARPPPDRAIERHTIERHAIERHAIGRHAIGIHL